MRPEGAEDLITEAEADAQQPSTHRVFGDLPGLEGATEYKDRTMTTTEAEITKARERQEQAYAKLQEAMANHQKQLENMPWQQMQQSRSSMGPSPLRPNRQPAATSEV